MINQFLRDAWRFIDHLSVQHWLYVLVAAIFVGFVCLRGFGSRSNY